MMTARPDRPCLFFFFNDTATTEIYTLSLHDALPIWLDPGQGGRRIHAKGHGDRPHGRERSEEHTSELQSRSDLVCRLLPEKRNRRSASSSMRRNGASTRGRAGRGATARSPSAPSRIVFFNGSGPAQIYPFPPPPRLPI